MNIVVIVSILAGVALLAAIVWRVNRVPRQYRGERRSHLRAWRQRFPDAPQPAIDAFLDLFTRAFDMRGRFGPDDQLMDIYRARYPIRDSYDSHEFEKLAQRLEADHGITFPMVWHAHLTLGELFAFIADAPRTRNLGSEVHSSGSRAAFVSEAG